MDLPNKIIEIKTLGPQGPVGPAGPPGPGFNPGDNITTTGYVSASEFYGDGSNLTGVTTNTGSFIVTASSDQLVFNTIYFTKGDGSTFSVDIPTPSPSPPPIPPTVNTSSFFTNATLIGGTLTFTRGDGNFLRLSLPSAFPYTGSAGINGDLNVTGFVSASTYYGDGSNLEGVEGFPYTGSAEITGSLGVTGSLSVLDGDISTNKGLYLGPNNNAFIRSSDLDHEFVFSNRAHWKKGSAYISSRGGQWVLSGNGIAEPNDYGQAFVHITKNSSISKKAFSLDFSNNGLKTTFDVNISGSLIIDSEGDVFINNNTIISGSLITSQSISASTYYGDGSNLQGIITSPFPYTGSAVITGSLSVVGDITGSNSIRLGTAIISSSLTRTSIGIGYGPYFFAGNNAITADRYYTYNEGSANQPSLYIGSSGGGAGRGIFGVPQGIGFSANNGVIGYIRGMSNDSSGGDTPRLGIGIDPSAHIDVAAHVSSSRNLLRISGSSLALNRQIFFISSSGNVGIGTFSPSEKLHVSGNMRLTGVLTGSLSVKSSGSTIFEVNGSAGQLFSITDSLSGSLFAVSDVSGLPILEVFSDDRVIAGKFNQNDFVISGSRVGIGTNSPQAKLHINGSLLTSGSTTISGSLRGSVIDITPSNQTASLNCSLGNFFTLTLSSSVNTFLTASNIQAGQSINLRIIQPATSGSLSYGSEFKFPNGLPYTASATSSVTDILSFITFDSTTLYGSSLKNFI